MEKIVLFNCDREQTAALKKLVSPMKIKVREVKREEYDQTIGSICGLEPAVSEEQPFMGEMPKESLLLFCEVSDKHFDKILAGMKREQIRVDFKAVVTSVNAKWKVLPLYLELARERAAYQKQGL